MRLAGTKINEMPFLDLIFVRDVLGYIWVSISIQIGIGVGWEVKYSIFGFPDPSTEDSISKLSSILVSGLIIRRQSEHEVPVLLVRQWGPFEPARNGVFWGKDSIATSHFDVGREFAGFHWGFDHIVGDLVVPSSYWGRPLFH